MTAVNSGGESESSAEVSGMNEGFAITLSKVQYRTYESGAGRYAANIDIAKDGKTVLSSDIETIELKDSTGNPVQMQPPSYYTDSYLKGTWDAATGTVTLPEPTEYSGFSISFPEGAGLPAGDYTWEVTTANGQILTETVYYPGKTELPTPESNSISHEWLPDGALKLSWSSPSGVYDEFSNYVSDQDESDLFTFTVPRDVEEVTVPATEVAKITAFRDPVSIVFYLRTRSKTEAGMEYARGYADHVTIPWN